MPPGMTTYYLGLVYRGPQWTPEDTAELQKLQEGHLANIRKLTQAGKMALAGPFLDGGDMRGIFLFTVGSIEEAQALADTDPAVRAGRLKVAIHPWMGPKTIRFDQPAKEASMFHGLRTAIYQVHDLKKATEWYSKVLGIKPYFDESYYVGFNVGGYELGLHPQESSASGKSTGVTAYWGVDNAEAAFNRLLELGATPHLKVMDVGEGIRVAAVLDPFGNVFGIIENPHFKLP